MLQHRAVLVLANIIEETWDFALAFFQCICSLSNIRGNASLCIPKGITATAEVGLCPKGTPTLLATTTRPARQDLLVVLQTKPPTADVTATAPGSGNERLRVFIHCV